MTRKQAELSFRRTEKSSVLPLTLLYGGLEMAKGTPKANKTAAPAKPASGTPKSKAAAAPPSTESASKKRVRLADDDSETAAAAAGADTPAKSAKKAKGGDGKSSKKAAAQSTTEVEVGSNGVERKDLKDKRPSEVEQIKSADAPKPAKGALKKSGNKEEEEASKTKGKGKGKKVASEEAAAEEEEEDEVKLAEGGDADEDEDDDEIDFLAGFESGEDDGEDSSDEEMGDDDEEEASKPKFDARQLPKVKGETVQKKLAAKEKKQVSPRNLATFFFPCDLRWLCADSFAVTAFSCRQRLARSTSAASRRVSTRTRCDPTSPSLVK